MQKHEVVNAILNQYARRAPIHRAGLNLLYDRAQNRGYKPGEIKEGLSILICKNYIRKEYIPPNNDPMQEVTHKRLYMEDEEFHDIFKRYIMQKPLNN